MPSIRGLIFNNLAMGQSSTSAPADTTAPTVEITSTAEATVYAAFSATITFSEPVVGFLVGDITAGNATLSEFAGSGAVYTVTVTPTAVGTVTLDITAGVCQDAAGNDNEAAAQFSRIAIVGAGLWIDASHAASLFQDSAGTTPAAADNDPVGRAGRVATNLATQATTANKPVLKLNIQNGLPVLRFDADDVLALANLSLLRNISSVSVIAVAKYLNVTSTRYLFSYSHGANATAARLGIGSRPAGVSGVGLQGRRLDTDAYKAVAGTAPTNEFIIQTSLVDYANSRAVAYANGAAIATDENFQTDGTTSDTDSLAAFVGGFASASYDNDLCELMVFVPALSDAQRQIVEAYLSAKWGITLS